MNRPTEGPGRVLAPQCRYWLPRHWTGARDCRAGCGVVEIPPRALTEVSVLARNGPGFVRRVVALQLPRIIPASQPLHHQSLAREHDEHLVVQRLGPAHVEHGPGRGRKSPAPSSHPPPAHTSHAPGAPLRPAPTAPLTPPSPWSRPTRARRTRPRIGRSPQEVRPRLAFPPRRTRPPAFARVAPTSRSVTMRPPRTAIVEPPEPSHRIQS